VAYVRLVGIWNDQGQVAFRHEGMPATGELVAAEIVLAEPVPDSAGADNIRTAALAVCRGGLEPHAVPRVLDIVKRIATTAAGKTPRRPTVTATT